MTTTRNLLLVASTLLACVALAPAWAADVPASGKQKLSDIEELGRRLFEDKNLSEPAGQACASCHEAQNAFTGNAGSTIAALAGGSRPDQFGSRNVPTAMYMSFSPPFSFVGEKNDKGETEYTPTGGFFWDGRANSLADQARGPFVNPAEMNNANDAAVVAKVRTAAYAPLMRSVFGADALKDDKAAFDNIVTAIAAFESSERFAPFTSKFDEVLRGNATFSDQEARGFDLFQSEEKGNCIGCHVGNPESKNPRDWLFTDFTYDNLGLPRNAAIPANKDPAHFDPGLCGQAGISSRLPEGVTLDSLCGAFKVPTLRNVAVTGPYFHNGAFSTLRDAVKFYVTRDTNPELWFPKDASGTPRKFNDLQVQHHPNVNTGEVPYDRKAGEQPRLSDAEVDDLVAFLNTLTDRTVGQ